MTEQRKEEAVYVSRAEELDPQSMEVSKPIVFFGDSIMASGETNSGGLSSGTSVPALIRQRTGADVYNFSISGTCMTYVSEADIQNGASQVYWNEMIRSSQLSMESLAEAITTDSLAAKQQVFAASGLEALYGNLTQFDFAQQQPVFCLAYGTNDCSCIRHENGLFDLQAFRDATRSVITKLRGAYLNAEIVLISPIWRGGNDPERGNVWDSTTLGPTAQGIDTRLTNVVCAMEEVAEELDVYFCNNYHLIDWETKEIFYEGTAAETDYVHPVEEGRRRMAARISAFLEAALGYPNDDTWEEQPNSPAAYAFKIIGRYGGTELYTKIYSVAAGDSVGTAFTAAEAAALATYQPVSGRTYQNPVYRDILARELSLAQLQAEVCTDDSAIWYIDYQSLDIANYYTVQFMDTLDGAYDLIKEFKNVPVGTVMNDCYTPGSTYYVPNPTRAGGYTFYGWSKAYPAPGLDPCYETIVSDTVFTVIWTNRDGFNVAGTVTGLYHPPVYYDFKIVGRYNGTTLYEKSYTIGENETVGTAFTETEAGNLLTYTTASGIIYQNPVYHDGSGNVLTLAQLQAKECTDNTSVWYVDYAAAEEPVAGVVYIPKLEVKTTALNPRENYMWGRARLNVSQYQSITLGNASLVNSDGTFSAPRRPTYYTTDTFPAVVVKGISDTDETTLGTEFNKTYDIAAYSMVELELRIFAKDGNGGTITLQDIELEKGEQTNTLTIPYLRSDTTDYNTNVYTRTMQTMTVNTSDFSTLSIGSFYLERCYREALFGVDYPYLKITGTANGTETVLRDSAGSGLMANANTNPITLNTAASYNIAAYDKVTIEIATNTQEGASVMQLNNIVFS